MNRQFPFYLGSLGAWYGGLGLQFVMFPWLVGKCDRIAVGRPFLANPDLGERWKAGAAVNAPDMNTFYTPGPKGYTDYPALKK